MEWLLHGIKLNIFIFGLLLSQIVAYDSLISLGIYPTIV